MIFPYSFTARAPHCRVAATQGTIGALEANVKARSVYPHANNSGVVETSFADMQNIHLHYAPLTKHPRPSMSWTKRNLWRRDKPLAILVPESELHAGVTGPKRIEVSWPMNDCWRDYNAGLPVTRDLHVD